MPSTTPRSKKSAKKTETAMKLRSPSRWTFSRRSSSRARAKASSSRPRGSLATIVSSSQTDGPAGKRSRFDPLRAIHYLRFRTPAAVFGEVPRRTRVASGMDFPLIKRLPPYVFNVVGDLKLQARRAGEDIVDFSMGNPDGASPPHVVEKLIEAVRKPQNHRYSVSRGIYKLRVAICDWYQRRYQVSLDPDAEAIVTIGAKEGLSHLAWATIDPGDVVLCPSPTYPIHQYAVVLAGGVLRCIPLTTSEAFFRYLEEAIRQTWPKPKMLILSFPHNPTTEVVELDFFDRVVKAAKEHGFIVVHDLAYADITFDGYQAPSFLQIPGAKDVGVEFFSLSKSYNMPGWRVGFCVGNREVIHALA